MNGESGRATHARCGLFALFFVVGILLVGITSSQKAWAGAEESKVVVLEVIESIFNAQSLDRAEELIHKDLVQNAQPNEALLTGLDGFKAHYGKIFKRFRTYQLDVHRITGDANMVGIQGRLHGVTEGNNEINFWVSDFYRLEDNKVIEFWRVKQAILD